MWCRSCSQEVPGLADGLDGRLACPRCSAVLLSDAGLDLTQDVSSVRPTPAEKTATSAYSSTVGDPYEPPVFEPVRSTAADASRVTTLRWDAANWELNEKLRHVERVTSSSRLRFDAPAAGTSPSPHGPWSPPPAVGYGSPYPRLPSFGANPYAGPSMPAGYAAPPQPVGPYSVPFPEPPPAPSPPPYEWNSAPLPRPEDHWDTPLEILASLTAWLFLGGAVMAFSCGGFLAAWGGIAGRPNLQNMGMPIIILGVGLMVIGLLPRIFLKRVEEEDRRRLREMQAAREQAAARYSPAARPPVREHTAA